MSESRQVVIATTILVPFIIAAMITVSSRAGTLSSMPWLAAGLYGSIVAAVAYFAVAIGLFLLLVHVARRGRNRVGALSGIVFVVVAAGVTMWFWQSWSYGERYQGYLATWGLAWLNAVSVLFVGATLVFAFRRPSLRANVIAHWCLVAWLFGWAFPYFGEYP